MSKLLKTALFAALLVSTAAGATTPVRHDAVQPTAKNETVWVDAALLGRNVDTSGIFVSNASGGN